MKNIKDIFYTSLRMYFAPLMGAYKAILEESKKYQSNHA